VILCTLPVTSVRRRGYCFTIVYFTKHCSSPKQRIRIPPAHHRGSGSSATAADIRAEATCRRTCGYHRVSAPHHRGMIPRVPLRAETTPLFEFESLVSQLQLPSPGMFSSLRCLNLHLNPPPTPLLLAWLLLLCLLQLQACATSHHTVPRNGSPVI
jgi:hypothetical protein